MTDLNLTSGVRRQIGPSAGDIERQGLPPSLPWVSTLLHNLQVLNSTGGLFEALHQGALQAGFSDISYMAGFAQEAESAPVGHAPSRLMHHSTCPGDWLEELFSQHGPENDYDFQRFLMGYTSPFVSGAAIFDLMPPLEVKAREILELKARHGFSANLIIPLPTTGFAKPCYAALMYTSDMDDEAFSRACALHHHILVAAAHLLHHRLGGNAYSVLEREANVAVCVREFNRERGDGPVPVLTDKQSEVLALLALGWRTDQISDHLGIARISVDRRLRAARAALGAKTTAEAIAQAVTGDLLDLRPPPEAD
jgi:DNA-binding CsgD family transcriptional regulator